MPHDPKQSDALDALSPRLRAVAALVRPGEAMADIGTDHGLLPLALARAHRVPRAFGCDLRARPLQVARRNLNGTGAAVELRLGDGLSPVAHEPLGTVTLAGMGGLSMVQILDRGPLERITRLVLAPNEGAEVARRGLWRLGFWMVAERVVTDQGRSYVVIAAERTAPNTVPDLLDFVVGPHIAGLLGQPRPDPDATKWAEQELARFERGLAGLDRAQALSPEARDKQANFEARARLFRGLLEQ